MRITLSAWAACGLFLLPACEKQPTAATPLPEPEAKTKTLETRRLGNAVDTFERNPTPSNRADVEKARAALDGEIAELEERVAKTEGDQRAEAAAKLKNLQGYRDAETARFVAMKAKDAVGMAPPADDRTGAQKAEDTASKVGGDIKDTAHKVGESIKDAVK